MQKPELIVYAQNHIPWGFGLGGFKDFSIVFNMYMLCIMVPEM